jgi:hypothetical protein
MARTDQFRSLPLGRELGGIPFLVTFAVLPESAFKVVDGEEELFCAPHVHGAEHAVVTHESLELASQRLSLDPICRGLAVL